MLRLRPEELGFGSAPRGGSLSIPGLHRGIRFPPEVRRIRWHIGSTPPISGHAECLLV